jgi:hypothetical protein
MATMVVLEALTQEQIVWMEAREASEAREAIRLAAAAAELSPEVTVNTVKWIAAAEALGIMAVRVE